MVSYKDKIYELHNAVSKVDALKKQGNKIVFTNGCFDLLHHGHIFYLEKSRQLGDFLVVGLNSDDSVKRLKGSGRPIKTLESRKAVLAGLASVDMVIVFEEDTPLHLIQNIVPDVLVKGGDYQKEDIVGGPFVVENGGSIEVIDFLEGYSSSSIVDKMENNGND